MTLMYKYICSGFKCTTPHISYVKLVYKPSVPAFSIFPPRFFSPQPQYLRRQPQTSCQPCQKPVKYKNATWWSCFKGRVKNMGKKENLRERSPWMILKKNMNTSHMLSPTALLVLSSSSAARRQIRADFKNKMQCHLLVQLCTCLFVHFLVQS